MKNEQDTTAGAVKALWQWAWVFLITLLILLFLLPFVVFRVGSVINRFARIWARIITRVMGLKVEVENKKFLTQNKSFILLVNHQSYLDIIALYYAFDLPLVWMAKASLFKVPFFGWAMSAMGCVPVKRGKAKEAKESLYQAALLVRKGRVLVIFPEGTRGNDDGSLIPFKKGAFVLAKKAQVPIQAITMFGPNLVLPTQSKTIIPRLYVNNVIRVLVHKPLEPEDYQELDVSVLQNNIYKLIGRPIDRLRVFNEILD